MRLLSLYRVDYCLECLGIIECQVCKHLTVQPYILLSQSADELRVVHTVLTGSGVDTLNPKRAEIAFLLLTVAVCVAQTFLVGVLGYSPDIFPCKEITACLFENFLTACS